MLYLIGMGFEQGDMSQKAQKAINQADKVFVEDYTSIPYEFQAEKLGRAQVESDFLLKLAKEQDIVLLIAGDPLFATTHLSLFIEARKAGIDCQVIHAPSVINVISRTGLSSYKFGRIVTLSKPFESDKKKIESNLKTDLHTLVLLDPFIDMQMGLAILSQFNIKSKLIACARLGTKTEMIKYALAAELEKIDFGDRPHCLIIPAKLQFFEQEFLELF